MDQFITLSTNDQKILKLSLQSALLSETIQNILGITLEDEDILDDLDISDTTVPLTGIDNIIVLEIIKEYMDIHSNNTENIDLVEWDKLYMKRHFETKDKDKLLFEVIMASNYLEIPSLLDLTCKWVANSIKECRTVQEIRNRFDIENDFTPEEEEAINTENIW